MKKKAKGGEVVRSGLGGTSRFFRLRRPKVGEGIRTRKNEEPPAHLRRRFLSPPKKSASPPASCVRSSDRSLGPKIEDGAGFFVLRSRISKIANNVKGCSFFGSENRKSKKTFYFRNRISKIVKIHSKIIFSSKIGKEFFGDGGSSKMKEIIYYSAPKNEAMFDFRNEDKIEDRHRPHSVTSSPTPCLYTPFPRKHF